jgi:hypothetical protein
VVTYPEFSIGGAETFYVEQTVKKRSKALFLAINIEVGYKG